MSKKRFLSLIVLNLVAKKSHIVYIYILYDQVDVQINNQIRVIIDELEVVMENQKTVSQKGLKRFFSSIIHTFPFRWREVLPRRA